ncbi:hypothetical protein Fmac_010185 [Flemingia macrophylla]|uniref:Zn-dependent metallo-hydrolase RNA specificity domain-containing protein n=1 Tax=Flemingia macrophylla TaxID=520843 RepID=A0ABD1N4V8_9FABA
MAKTILSEPKEVSLMNGLSVALNIRLDYISFSAHADCIQTCAFLEEFNPLNIILVHGEAKQMKRLKQKLMIQFVDHNTKVFLVERTMAKTILSEPKEVFLMNGLLGALNMRVDYISCSG